MLHSGYPPFVSKSRLQTRQKIMNWRSSLRFPAHPRVSREAQDLITSLICEKEDRLGSRGTASLSRPNSVLTQRRSEFNLNTAGGPAPGGYDRNMNEGADEIKAHPFFRGIDFNTIHLQTPPFVPELSSPGDTRYFEDDIDDVSSCHFACFAQRLIVGRYAEPSPGSRCRSRRSGRRLNQGPDAS